MMRSFNPFLYIIGLLLVGVHSLSAQSLPSEILANPQSAMAGKVLMTGTRDAPPLTVNAQHAQRLADVIFNNDLHRPIIHATYSELQTWMSAALQPYHETYQATLRWNGSSVSETTVQDVCLLAPLGREMYCGTDGIRQVEEIIEGDFHAFTVYPSPSNSTLTNRLCWARPHGALILYPLAWLAPCGLHFTETLLPDGAYELRGNSPASGSPVSNLYLKTIPNHPDWIQEVRYQYSQPDSPGNWLIQGQFSNHQMLSATVAFPGSIVWIVRFIPATETVSDLTVPITYDPTRDSRHVLTLSTFEFGSKNDLFPNHFLPDVPTECQYIDERYPKGFPERSDPNLVDYRSVTP